MTTDGPRVAGAGVEATVAPLLLTPEEAARALRIGRTRLYALLAEGTLRSVRIGASRRIPREALEELVTSLTSPGASSGTRATDDDRSTPSLPTSTMIPPPPGRRPRRRPAAREAPCLPLDLP